jgi:hypothetical protein
VAISYGDLGTVGSADGSDAFRRSPHGAAVFEVSAAQRPRVLEWARGQRVPHAARRPVHTPSVDAWAVLDGGVVHLYGYGLTTLPAGVHVVGLQAFRLILAELGFPVPDGLTEASTITAPDLRARLAGSSAADPSMIEQAELLATCTDATMLRFVATTLLAEYGTSAGHSGTR